MTSLRDEARRLAEDTWNRADFLNKQLFEKHVESALLAFAKLVVERPFQQRADFDEELFDLCRRDDYDGLWRAMISELLRELEEGSNIGSHQPKEQP